MSRKRESGPQHGAGYGPPCPSNPEHGRLIDLPSGKWYCPHSDHSYPLTQTIFGDREAFGE